MTVIALALAVCAIPARAQTLKLGTIAPENSPWGNGLKRLAAEWKRVSGGSVELRNFYGTLGDEMNILKKMKVGGLDIGVFTTQGLARLFDDVLILSLPSIVQTDSELTQVLSKLDRSFRAGIEARGYTVISWSKGGWLYFFSRKPVSKPSDLVGLKVAIAPDDAKTSRMLGAAGMITVPVMANDMMGQFTTGGIDAFIMSPLLVAAQWSFLRTAKVYMIDLRIAPFIGGIVATTKGWERVPAALRPALVAAAERMSMDIGADFERSETIAIETLRKDGLTVVPVGEADRKAWNAEFVTNRDRFIKGLFSKEILGLIDEAVAGMRK